MGSLGALCDIDDPFACCDSGTVTSTGGNVSVGGKCVLQCAATMTATPKCTAPCLRDVDCAEFLPQGEYSVSYGDVQCSHIAGLGSEHHHGSGACVYEDMSWVIGVSMTIVGMTISNVGTQISKVALNKHQHCVASGIEAQKSAYCLPLYCLGLAGMIGGAVLDFLALAFAAQSLLAPLAACTLIVNMCLAPFVAKEKPGKLELFATLTITIGAVVSVAFAAHETKTYSLEQMIPYFVDRGFLTWVGCTFVFAMSGCMVLRDGKPELDAIFLMQSPSRPLLLHARDSHDDDGIGGVGGIGNEARAGGSSSSSSPAAATATSAQPVLVEMLDAAENGSAGVAGGGGSSGSPRSLGGEEPPSPTYRFTAPLRRLPNVYAFYCGALAGLSSGNSLLFAKGAL